MRSAGVATFALFIIGHVAAIPTYSAPPQSITSQVVAIATDKGTPLPTSFEELPTDPRFAKGTNPYKLVRADCKQQSMVSRIGRMLGLTWTVQAQSGDCGLSQGCTNCYQSLAPWSCGSTCPYGAYSQLISGSTCRTGSCFKATILCQSSCSVDTYILCYNSNCTCSGIETSFKWRYNALA